MQGRGSLERAMPPKQSAEATGVAKPGPAQADGAVAEKGYWRSQGAPHAALQVSGGALTVGRERSSFGWTFGATSSVLNIQQRGLDQNKCIIVGIKGNHGTGLFVEPWEYDLDRLVLSHLFLYMPNCHWRQRSPIGPGLHTSGEDSPVGEPDQGINHWVWAAQEVEGPRLVPLSLSSWSRISLPKSEKYALSQEGLLGVQPVIGNLLKQGLLKPVSLLAIPPSSLLGNQMGNSD